MLAVLLVTITVSCATTYWLYAAMQRVFRSALDERLMAIASVAATRFDPSALDQIQRHDDFKTDAYRRIVLELQQILRNSRREIRLYPPQDLRSKHDGLRGRCRFTHAGRAG